MTLTQGARIGRWTLLEYRAGKQPHKRNGQPTGKRIYAVWKCQCSCGAIAWVLADNLRHQGKPNGTTGCRACAKLGRPTHKANARLLHEAASTIQSALCAWGKMSADTRIEP